jgi:hypothetical protein
MFKFLAFVIELSFQFAIFGCELFDLLLQTGMSLVLGFHLVF